MQYKYTVLLALILVVFLFCQCTEKGSVPGYIRIDQVKVDGEYNPGIYDAWVYVNDYLIGVYELPANIPIIATDEAKISIGAGIKVNGLSGNRARYPFYNFYTTTRDLDEAKTIELSPSVSYYSWTNFLMRENFEKAELQLTIGSEDEDNQTDTVLFVSDTVHYVGSKAGVFKLDREKKDTVITFKTSRYFERPAVDNTVGTFLELNYKGTGYMAIGLYVTYMSNVEDIYIVHITPSAQWKKVYVDIGSQITQYPEGTPYQVYFASYLSSESQSAYGAIDDLRLVQKNSK